MTLDNRISSLEDDHGTGRYIAVVWDEDEIPDTVTASLPGGRDRQEMASDDPRLKTIIHVTYTEETL